MSNYQFSNNASTTLGSNLSSTATTATVATGTGSSFPALTGSQFFTATLWAAGNTTGVPNEIVKVIARSGDTMTIVRGQEGTTAQNWNVGDTFANYATAAFWNGTVEATDIQISVYSFFPDTGTANAYIITPSPAVSSNPEGSIFWTQIAHANTGNSTLQVGSEAAATIHDVNGAPIQADALPTGMIAGFVKNSSGNWQIVQGRSNNNETFNGITTFGTGAIITAGGIYTSSTNPALQLGPFAVLNSAAAKGSIEDNSGTALQIANTLNSGSVEPTFIVQSINSNVFPISFLYSASNTQVGSVTYTGGGTGVAYNVSSDYRIKNIEGLLEGSWDRIKNLKVYQGKFKNDPNQKLTAMFLAHEVEEAASILGAVSGEKDAEVDIGDVYIPAGTIVDGKASSEEISLAENARKPSVLKAGTAWRKTGRTADLQQLSPTHLIPDLWSGQAEAQARIEALEETVKALLERFANDSK